jgi:protein-tyrosine phosphatase
VVRHILNVTADNPPREEVKAVCEVLHLPLQDKPSFNISETLNQTHEWISKVLADDPSHAVLVHCSAGQSRSAIMVIHHVMRSQGISALEALQHVKVKKNNINPNYDSSSSWLKPRELILHQSIGSNMWWTN